jgi:hypothetical protein
MAAPNLIARDSGGVPITVPIEFTDVVPGIGSAAVEFQIFNDDTSTPRDTAQNPVTSVTQVDDTTGDPVSSGLRAINEGWIEVRALGGGSAGSLQPATAWTPMTGQTRLRLVPLPGGEYHSMEVRYRPPGSAAETDISFFVNADADTRQQFIGLGHTEAYRDGVLTGTGESEQRYLWMQGTSGTEQGLIENTVPDADVIMPDVGYTYLGVPYFRLTELLTFNNLDGSASPLAGGEEYWATVALDETGWVVFKSDKETSPIPASSRVPVDDDEILVAYVLVDSTVTIQNADITSAARARRFELLDLASGLSVTIGGGRARVNNALVETQVVSALALTDNSVNYVWLQASDAIFALTVVDVPPSPNAYKIWEITTSGGVVTGFEDQRQEMGGQVLPVQLFFDGDVTDGDTAYAVLPAHKDSYLLGVRPIVLRMDYVGLNLDQGVFPSSATDDRRPGFAWDDAYPLRDESAAPETYVLESGAMIRGRIVELTAFNGPVPGIAESPARAMAVVFVEVP